MSATAEVDSRNPTDRKAALEKAIAYQVRMGWRVESQTDYQAVIVKGKNHSHVLHLILTLVTLGLWLLVWIPLSIFGGEKRGLITVSDSGRVSVTRA